MSHDKHTIKRRTFEDGYRSPSRPLFVHIRISPKTSANLMKYQGLCYKFGDGESLQILFERVCMPAISAYVARYAKLAEIARFAQSVKTKGADQ